MPLDSPNGAGNLALMGMSRRGPFGPGDFKPTVGGPYALGAQAAQFAIQIKDPPAGHAQMFGVGHGLLVQALTPNGVLQNWWRVDAAFDPGSSAGYWIYTCTRMSGPAATFPPGTTIVDYGASGAGWISFSADGTIGASPNISMGTHSGQPWLSTTLISRWGNLNGSYGIATNTPGIGIGDYAGGNYLKYDTVNGFKLSAGGGAITLDATGIAITSDSVGINGAHAVNWTNNGLNVGFINAFVAADVFGGTSAGIEIDGNYAKSQNDGFVQAVARSSKSDGIVGGAVYMGIFADGHGASEKTFGFFGSSFSSTFAGLIVGALSTAPGAMLDVRGSGIFTGGLNVGTATGAATGDVKASGNGNFTGTLTAAGGSWTGSPTLTTPTIADFTNAGHTHGNTVNGGALAASITLTTPTIASFVNAGHTHGNAAGGGSLATSITLVTPTISDFTNAGHTHANAANGGSLVASITLTTPTIASFVNAGHTHGNAAGGGSLATSITLTTPTIADFTNAGHTHGNTVGGGNLAASITLTTPTIANFTNANHNHTNAAGGGTLTTVNADKGVRAYHSTTQAIARTTWTTVALNSERWDTDSIHDTVTNNSRLTCNTAGKYLITAHADFGTFGAVTPLGVRIMLNGATVLAQQMFNTTNSGLEVATLYSLAATDYVEMQVYQDAATSQNLLNTGNYSPEFSMQKIA